MRSLKSALIVVAMLIACQPLFSQNIIVSRDSSYIPPVELETFEVQATKKKNELQKLPMAASVIKNRDLEQREMNSLTELSSRVPNLFMPNYGSKLTSPIYIRGIGSRINSPSVGLYVDNVPYFQKSAFNFEFFDIERIEVLRGPQGTLYGRNTMGGIINIETQSPLERRQTDITLKAGNYQSYKTIISHHQPVSDELGISVNGAYVNRNGFHTNQFTDAPADDITSYSGRVRAVYQPKKNLTIDYSLNFEDSDQAGYPYAVFTDSTNTAGDISYNRKSTYVREMLSNNVTVKLEQENSILKSVTSHQYLDGDQRIDQDFTPASLLFVGQFQEQHMVSQEFYLKSKPNTGNYSWLVGAFGFMQLQDKTVDVDFGEDGVNAFNLPGPLSKQKLYDQNTYGAALFHQSTLEDFLVKGLDLTGGLRFDYETASLDYEYNTLMNGQTMPVTDFNNSLEFLEILPSFSVKYKLGERRNVFATISKGYKTGGFNSTFERKQDRTFNPEHSWNYEVGYKSRYYKNRLQTNLSLFYIDWLNQQIYQPVPSGQGSMLKNAGRSESKGFELEFRGLPTTHTEAFFSVGYTDAKFVDYVDGENDYSGNRIPYIPQYTFHLGGTYEHQLDYDWLDEVMFQVDYRGVGKHYWQEENISYQDYYGLLNSKISFRKDDLTLSVWGKNMLNATYQSFYFQAIGNSYVQMGQPALYGLRVDFHF